MLKGKLWWASVILVGIAIVGLACEKKPNDGNDSCHTPAELVGVWTFEKVVYTTPYGRYTINPAQFFGWDTSIAYGTLTINNDCTFLCQVHSHDGTVYLLQRGNFSATDSTFSITIQKFDIPDGRWDVDGDQLILTAIVYQGSQKLTTELYMRKETHQQ